MIGIEPIVTKVGRFTVSCHTITAASPLYWSEYKDSNLGPPGPKPGALARLRHTPNKLVPQEGIEPPHPAYKTGPLPLRIQGLNWLLRLGSNQ